MSERSGSGMNPVVAVLAAIVIVGGIVGGYIWATWTGPVHAGKVTALTVYPIHRELSTAAALGGISGGPSVYNELIVVANVRIKSTTKLPLFLHDMWADLTLQDGTSQRCWATDETEYNKVFVAYPKLRSIQTQPVMRSITMKPGQTVDGQMIFHFPVTEKEWKDRKSFRVTVEFLHQNNLVMPATVAATTIQP